MGIGRRVTHRVPRGKVCHVISVKLFRLAKVFWEPGGIHFWGVYIKAQINDITTHLD